MLNKNHLPMPLQWTDHKHRTWRPYAIEFDSPDGRYSVYIYAISFDHAHLQLEALKETGTVAGEVQGAVGG